MKWKFFKKNKEKKLTDKVTEELPEEEKVDETNEEPVEETVEDTEEKKEYKAAILIDVVRGDPIVVGDVANGFSYIDERVPDEFIKLIKLEVFRKLDTATALKVIASIYRLRPEKVRETKKIVGVYDGPADMKSFLEWAKTHTVRTDDEMTMNKPTADDLLKTIADNHTKNR